MSFFSNLNIKHKILSVVMVIVFLELALFAGGIYFLNTLNNHLVQLVDIDARKMKLAAEVKSDMLEIHRAQKNIILHPSKEEVGRQMIQKSRYISDFRIHLAELERLTNPQERLSIVELSNGMQAFLTIDKQIEALVQPDAMDGFTQGAFAAATALSIGSARVAYNQSSQLIDTIIEEMEKALDTHRIESGHYFNLALLLMLMLCFAGLIIGWVAGLMVARNIAANLEGIIQVTDAIAQGRLDTPVVVKNNDETGRLAASVLKMQAQLIDVKNAAADRDWVKTGVARINDAMRGVVNIPELCRNVITEMATYMEAGVGAIFLSNHSGAEPVLELGGGYAYTTAHPFLDHFHAGEGLVGQAMLTKAPITVQNVPSDYFKVCSGLGDGCPAALIVAPLLFEDQATGVAELGFFKPPTELQLDYLQQILPAVAITIETVRGRERVSKALARAQVLAEELQQQQDELKATNEELEEQTQRLKDSEQKLKQQQNELEEANAELEEKNEYLQNQKEVIERANRELDRTRLDIEEKAEQLAMASKYKSEFLANMSHELRTPLNSILLLARMLSDNSDGNLTLEQVQSAEIIASSGNDLLTLINEVLDLAKIEAGRMELNIERIDVQELKESITYHYAHLARDKGLSIDVSTRPECPAELHTDRKRLDQILRNLVSNAVKFTEKGGIRIEIGRAAGDEINGARTVAITVTDTGIGIPADKQKVVFEAFQQLDTGTARKFPGTGLGLSICKNLANLLGGDILLQSQSGIGSTFTLILPDEWRPSAADSAAIERLKRTPPRTRSETTPAPASAPAQVNVPDDRDALAPGDATILIIEDDPIFAGHLIGLCRQKTFKVLHAPTGEQGLELAELYLPKGILLDLHLPSKDGWDVLECLKQNLKTRHIPVHIISADEVDIEAYAKGAVGFLTKPVQGEELEKALARLEHVFERAIKELLVVEDDARLRKNIVALIGNNDVHAEEAGSAAEAMTALCAKQYDCMILDLGLPDMNGLDMLRQLEKESGAHPPPVIVYTGRELTREQETELQRYSESIIIKGVRSEERLYDEASLFLHRIVDRMPEKKRRLITNLYDTDVMFRDKKVLIADDDMRSVFALSKLLEAKGVRILKAENGRKAIDLLEKHADTDLILMDMMMPVMDGYETMQRIRSSDCWRSIPVIALTAKAMKQDRERCIQAGASDYLSKPVDMVKLCSMMRVWMYR
jgi:CheY-like chemotaxis protein